MRNLRSRYSYAVHGELREHGLVHSVPGDQDARRTLHEYVSQPLRPADSERSLLQFLWSRRGTGEVSECDPKLLLLGHERPSVAHNGNRRGDEGLYIRRG